MKIELDETLSGKYRIDAYSSDGVVINETLYEGSLLVTPDEIVADWPPRNLNDLTVDRVRELAARDPEIVLLGTGARLCFPDQYLLEPLLHNNIGFEIMDTGAACRAYNFMMAEGRNILAALLRFEIE